MRALICAGQAELNKTRWSVRRKFGSLGVARLFGENLGVFGFLGVAWLFERSWLSWGSMVIWANVALLGSLRDVSFYLTVSPQISNLLGKGLR